MTTKIIQHHDSFDFEMFYGTIKAGYIGIDYEDFAYFMNHDGEKHSFIGRAEGKDRLKNAIERAIACDEAVKNLNRASLIMITVVRSPEAELPLLMDEMQYVNEFADGLPSDCDVIWGFADDNSLGNEVKVILLAAVKSKGYGVSC